MYDERYGNGDEALETLSKVFRQGNGEVRACTNGQRHIEREKTTEARVEN
jgi:hypothetical protein